MKDKIGREIKEGDLVFIIDSTGSGIHFTPALAVGFTRTLVKLACISGERKKSSGNLLIATPEDFRVYKEHKYPLGHPFGHSNIREKHIVNLRERVEELIEKNLEYL